MAEVDCMRCGKRGAAIEGVPYGGKIGAMLKEKVCDPCWKEWYEHSIKLINEYRISLKNAEGREFLASQMKIFFKIEGGAETGAEVPQTPQNPPKTD